MRFLVSAFVWLGGFLLLKSVLSPGLIYLAIFVAHFVAELPLPPVWTQALEELPVWCYLALAITYATRKTKTVRQANSDTSRSTDHKQQQSSQSYDEMLDDLMISEGCPNFDHPCRESHDKENS